MDWNKVVGENIKALRRIVAMLLALAGLAERASGRSRPVRFLVLWLLRPAEEVARDYVAGLTLSADWNGQSGPMAFLHDGDGPDNAMRLALSFRTLAAALAALTAEMVASRDAGVQILCAGLAQRVAGVLAAFGDPLSALAVERRDSS